MAGNSQITSRSLAPHSPHVGTQQKIESRQRDLIDRKNDCIRNQESSICHELGGVSLAQLDLRDEHLIAKSFVERLTFPCCR